MFRPDCVTPAFITEDIALLGLLTGLKADGYHFVTPTPATHARVVARPDHRQAATKRDMLGWSLPFDPSGIEQEVIAALDAAGMIDLDGDVARSRVRVSSLGNGLFLHSGYPTTASDAVFFGPDSYRFANLIEAEFERHPPRLGAHIVDIGTGAGVGAIVAARLAPHARITATDINRQALRFARINAAAAGVSIGTQLDRDLSGVADPIDVALANPPYLVDSAGRDYRDGGELHGGAVALDMARSAAERLAPGGRLILYTGSAVVDGRHPLQEALSRVARDAGLTMRFREIDPDVFGEELSEPAYADVERIALVAAILEGKR